MKHIQWKTPALAGALLFGSTFAATPVFADHHEGGMEESAPMFSASSCTYRPGKGRDDMMKAVDYWKTQMGRIDSPEMDRYFAALFEPVFSSGDQDFYWIGVSPDLRTMMAGGAAYSSSREGRAADARFDEVADCTTSAWMSKQIHDSGGDMPAEGDPGMVETFACTLHEGHRMSDLDAADAFFSSTLAEMGAEADAWRLAPAWGTDGEVDVVYLVGHDSGTSLADMTTRMMSSPQGEMVSGWYSELVECASGLHATTILRMPTAAR